MELTDKVDKIMTSNIVSFSKEVELQKIVDTMKEKNISTVILLDDGELSGIITERDMVHRVLKENLDVSQLKAKDVMTGLPLITIEPGKTIGDVVVLMKKFHIKSIPVVVANTDCTGLITQTDIVHALIQP